MSLSAAQLETIKDIRAKAAREAAPTALRLAATIKQIYTNMLADKPDAKLRARLSKQMTDNTVKLLLIKGQSIREMVNALTPEQKRMLKSEMEKPGTPADLSELMEHIFNVPKQ
jgi:Spy/CpxP family protein refolding chaperone